VEEIMNGSDNLKQYADPLLGGIRNQKKKAKEEASPVHGEDKRGKPAWLFLTIPVILALALLGYYLHQAQTQLEVLADELAVNKGHLDEVTVNLEESQEEIAGLNEGLETSRNQLASQNRRLNQYKTLYSDLKDEQSQQTRELEAIDLEKANRTEVNALKNETVQLQEKVNETDSNVAQIREQSNSNQNRIAETQTLIASVQESVNSNTDEIDGVKRSLEREYYNFELQEKGGYMKVFEVSLKLRDTDRRKRQFDMYLLADGKVIQKKDHSVNEPILFYVEAQKKPYEVVVTRVDEKLVVGYLSVPKGS
jgi:hypothetical protein